MRIGQKSVMTGLCASLALAAFGLPAGSSAGASDPAYKALFERLRPDHRFFAMVKYYRRNVPERALEARVRWVNGLPPIHQARLERVMADNFNAMPAAQQVQILSTGLKGPWKPRDGFLVRPPGQRVEQKTYETLAAFAKDFNNFHMHFIAFENNWWGNLSREAKLRLERAQPDLVSELTRSLTAWHRRLRWLVPVRSQIVAHLERSAESGKGVRAFVAALRRGDLPQTMTWLRENAVDRVKLQIAVGRQVAWPLSETLVSKALDPAQYTVDKGLLTQLFTAYKQMSKMVYTCDPGVRGPDDRDFLTR